MKRSRKQIAAQKRNFNVMVLRGMYQQIRRIEGEHPELKKPVEELYYYIDMCLSKLKAETQTDRLKNFRWPRATP